MLSMSGSKGAAKAGSLCMKVPKVTIQSPISSSLYSSLTVPHSEQRSFTHSSPILNELCFMSLPSNFGDNWGLNQAPGLRGSCIEYEPIVKGPTLRIRCRWLTSMSPGKSSFKKNQKQSLLLLAKRNVTGQVTV
jgi:hypothetical protein